MTLAPRRLALAVALTLPALAQAAPFMIFEARSFGMGGAGVAASEHAAAAFFNPALLASRSETGSFSFIAPGLGASAAGNKGAIDAVQDIDDHQSVDRLTQAANAFQTAFDACGSLAGCANDPGLMSASGGVATAAQTVIDDLKGLDGKTYQVAAGGVMSVALPKWTYKGAVSLNVEFFGRATPVIDQSDLTLGQVVVDGATLFANSGSAVDLASFAQANGDLDFGNSSSDYNSKFKVVGVAIVDFGVSLAHAVSLGDQKLLIGVTPKIQQVSTVAYTADVDNLDFNLDQNRRKGSALNLDVGFATEFDDGPMKDVRLGLVVRNLIPKTYETSDPTQSVKIAPQLRAGVAWTGRYGTLTSDIDLTANKLLGGGEGSSQFVALGGELNAGNIAKLRLGMRQDIKQKYTALTAGVSLFGVQLSAAYSKDRELAAMAQFGLSF